MAQPATVINRDVLHNTVEGKPGYASTVTFSPSDISRELSSGIQSVIGRHSSKGDISHVLNSGYVSMQEGNPHSTTSLQRAIAGTARQLNLSMAVWVSAAKDPLKLCLGTEIMNEEKLIITRQYVAGGGAQLTAERAPARLISIKEDQREARVERYGVDIEMSLNTFLKPEIAAQEFTTKVEGQRSYLEEAAVSIAYEEVQAQGTCIVKALQRALPSHGASEAQRMRDADRTYVGTIFAAMNKWKFPVPNLMAALSLANVYTPTGASRRAMSVMVTPPGMIDTSPLTREDHMKYFISGLSEDQTNKVSMPMGTTLVEKTTGMKVLVHWPMSSFQGRGGAAYPQVVSNELQEPVQFATYYPLDTRTIGKMDYNLAEGDGENNQAEEGNPENNQAEEGNRENVQADRLVMENSPVDMGITDFKNQEWGHVDFSITGIERALHDQVKYDHVGRKFMTNDRQEAHVFLLRPQMVLMMNNALFFSDPGVNTGSFLVAFPHTGVSTNQVNESMRLSMRIHLGCIIKQPENVIVMRHVQCAGFVKGHGCNIAPSIEEFQSPSTEDFGDGGHDLLFMAKLKRTSWNQLFEDTLFRKLNEDHEGPYKHLVEFADGHKDEEYDADDDGVPNEMPVVVYRGAVKNMKTDKIVYRNNGHLGPLDHPACCDMIAGRQKYGEIPDIRDM